eukprot:11205413-Lingulodinium_polyedra.AAC.1
MCLWARVWWLTYLDIRLSSWSTFLSLARRSPSMLCRFTVVGRRRCPRALLQRCVPPRSVAKWI